MMVKFTHKTNRIGKLTGDGECGRFLDENGELLYIEDLFIPSLYEEYEQKHSSLYRRTYPDWKSYHEDSPWINIKVSVEIEVLDDIKNKKLYDPKTKGLVDL